VGAVSEDQADNTWSVVHYYLTANDGRAADELGVDPGLTRCFVRERPGAKAEPVSASFGSREGQPITYAALDETHLWTPRNGGLKLAATLRRNVAKMGGRSYETTNAFIPGEGSVAEASWAAVDAGAAGVLADEVEAPRVIGGVPVNLEAPDDVLAAALEVAYGDAFWVDIPRLVEDIRDPDSKWEDSSRYFFNWNEKGDDTAVDPVALTGATAPRVVADGERIGLGFDGSISDDSTFLVGCTVDGHIFTLGKWERPRHADGRPVKGWHVPRAEVGDVVRDVFARYDVGRMFGDPPRWATELDTWADEFRLTDGTPEQRERVLLLDTLQHSKFARCVDRFLTGLRAGVVSFEPDPDLASHLLAARLHRVRTNADPDDPRTLHVLVKPADGRKIDGAVASVLAYEAAMTMPAPVAALVPFAAFT
jgi:hypothetical protein